MKPVEKVRHRILVVDDEEWNLDVFTGHLQREGFEVLCAKRGDEALKIISSSEVDLVILDVMMPGKDGFQVCREIIADNKLKHIPVILATALNETGHKVEGLKAGATDFLSKPVDQSELIARVRAHLRVKRLFEETCRQKSELEQAYGKLKELSALQNRLTVTVTHELRSPLAAIHLGLENLFLQGEKSLAPKQTALIRRMRSHIARLTTLVNGILDLEQLESEGTARMHFTECDLHEVVEEVIELQGAAAAHKGCYLKYEADRSLGLVQIDRDRMTQIVMNLVNNAIKYTDTGGVTVTSCLKASDKKFVIDVRDTGPGISSEDLARLFQKFQRLEGAYQSNMPGSGLGLYITKELVARHGGEIQCTSELGKGSCFSVCFPLEPET